MYSETEINQKGVEWLRLLNEIIGDFDDVKHTCTCPMYIPYGWSVELWGLQRKRRREGLEKEGQASGPPVEIWRRDSCGFLPSLWTGEIGEEGDGVCMHKVTFRAYHISVRPDENKNKLCHFVDKAV